MQKGVPHKMDDTRFALFAIMNDGSGLLAPYTYHFPAALSRSAREFIRENYDCRRGVSHPPESSSLFA